MVNLKGQISDKHPLGCGVIGESGAPPIASWFINEADFLNPKWKYILLKKHWKLISSAFFINGIFTKKNGVSLEL